MSNKDNVGINIISELHKSKYYNKLIEDEFKEIISSQELIENHIQISSSFIYENEDFIEIGVYIINTSNKEILMRRLPLKINFDDRNSIDYILYIDKLIGIKKALFKEIKIYKEDIKFDFKINNVSLSIDKLNKIKKYPYINIEVDNIPNFNKYTQYRDIKKFIKNIYPMQLKQLCIDVFKVGCIDEGFFMILLLRNSSHKEINIKSLPITVYTYNDLIIYRGVFLPKDDSLLIPGNKGKIKTIIIPYSSFPLLDNQDYSSYKVKFN